MYFLTREQQTQFKQDATELWERSILLIEINQTRELRRKALTNNRSPFNRDAYFMKLVSLFDNFIQTLQLNHKNVYPRYSRLFSFRRKKMPERDLCNLKRYQTLARNIQATKDLRTLFPSTGDVLRNIQSMLSEVFNIANDAVIIKSEQVENSAIKPESTKHFQRAK